MRVLVTRPEDDTTALARLLGEHGIDAMIEPLLVIEHAPPAAFGLEGVQAVLMTSANGARAFAASTERRDLAVFAVGDATARAAAEAGFTTIENAAGDVGALAELVKERLDPGAGGLVHAAASEVAGALGDALRASGFAYRREILYRARQTTAFSQAAHRALRDHALDGALFFSPRTAQTFVSLVLDGRLCECCEVMVAFCLSAAVAGELAALPWRAVRIARRPNQGSLVSLVEDMAGNRTGGRWDDS
ncbi:MAG TPA: uroporphyrinogen-III synthase [Rhodospirillales bacterium]|nr:uroporphyrinogen-III synthase [Rhodospirillales bacterium]HJO68913.1 uroporphyrinogen-III synthase [Rhodospirillales bacterium]